MKNNTFSFLLLTSVLVSGCAAINDSLKKTEKINLQAPFNLAETEKMLVKGDNSINGSALLRMMGSGTATCAGSNVFLIPATNYSKERIIAIYGNDQKAYISHRDMKKQEFTTQPEGYIKNMKKTECDTQGYFKFKDLADGSFFVLVKIIWRRSKLAYWEGGSLMERVDLSNGENKEIVLSQ